jgi:hypothetical protein
LALSHLSYFLNIGCQNGNVSKAKFVIDRDRAALSNNSNAINPLTAQIIRQRPTLPIEHILPSIKIDGNCFKTVDIFQFKSY